MTQTKQTYEKSEMKQEARLEYIAANGIFMTQEELAENLGVSRSTIKRDLQTWYDTNGFKQFIIGEFLENYGKAKRQEKPIKLLDRTITMFKYLPPETAQEAINEIKLSWNLDKLKYLNKDKTTPNKHKNTTLVMGPSTH